MGAVNRRPHSSPLITNSIAALRSARVHARKVATKKDRPERRPKSREETPKKGMQPKGCRDETTLHCEICKPHLGLFSFVAPRVTSRPHGPLSTPDGDQVRRFGDGFG